MSCEVVSIFSFLFQACFDNPLYPSLIDVSSLSLTVSPLIKKTRKEIISSQAIHTQPLFVSLKRKSLYLYLFCGLHKGGRPNGKIKNATERDVCQKRTDEQICVIFFEAKKTRVVCFRQLLAIANDFRIIQEIERYFFQRDVHKYHKC